jgi:hypothetical protein
MLQRNSSVWVAGGEFLKKVDEELAKALGPIASVIMYDQIAEMGKQWDAFPGNKAAELVEAVSSEIADEGKRVRFQRNMLRYYGVSKIGASQV